MARAVAAEYLEKAPGRNRPSGCQRNFCGYWFRPGRRCRFATRLKCLLSNHAQGDEQAAGGQMPDRVPISATEGMSVQWSKCCSPIPGDEIIGCIGAGLGMAIHTTDCCVGYGVHRRDPNQWIDVSWTPAPGRLFDVRVNALVHQSKGILARITADITSAGA